MIRNLLIKLNNIWYYRSLNFLNKSELHYPHHHVHAQDNAILFGFGLLLVVH